MLKYLTLIILSLSLLMGQSDRFDQASIELNISATVVDFLEMITLSDIDVGTVQPSQMEIRLDPRLDQGAGLIKIQGRQSSSIRIAFTQQVEMVNSATNHTMSIMYNLSGNSLNEQSSSNPINENPVSVNMSSNGEYYIWIGCYFSLAGVTAGTYDGDFVIEVEYN
ncbi:MAG: hypothetical protein HQ562_01975 [Candidatus Marinimicrobia bacterium]|nr:hypothetical protein [Candidatus Neomarinimicrobiota bacterium]